MAFSGPRTGAAGLALILCLGIAVLGASPRQGRASRPGEKTKPAPPPEPAKEAPPAPAPAPETPPEPPFEWRKVPNNAFRVGESILYTIKYGFISAGHATLEVKTVQTAPNGRQAYHLLSRARTNKTMDLMFKVRDKNESWMDVESLCSLQFTQNIREGLYQKEVRTLYDHPRGRFTYWKKRKGKEETIEGGIPPFVQDVLSSLYYIRTQALEPNKDYAMDANSGARTWPLKVHVRKVEKVKVPAGKFECFHVEPILAGEGIFQQSGRLEVWLTKDERKIPVLLKSRVVFGSFDAVMTEYSSGEEGSGGIDLGEEPEEGHPDPAGP